MRAPFLITCPAQQWPPHPMQAQSLGQMVDTKDKRFDIKALVLIMMAAFQR
jgi:hypothetical protein